MSRKSFVIYSRAISLLQINKGTSVNIIYAIKCIGARLTVSPIFARKNQNFAEKFVIDIDRCLAMPL